MGEVEQNVIITRRRKREAEQAIDDLLKRGYTIIYPLTENTRDGKQFTTDSFNRRIFQNNTFSSYWRAKLRRVVSD
jgi:hypothetical protein